MSSMNSIKGKGESLKRILAVCLTLAMVLATLVVSGPARQVQAAEGASLTIKASKTLDGAAPAAGQFEFQILDSNKSEVKSAKNDAQGNVVFDALTFSAAGTYTYTVKEKVPAGVDANNTKDGIKYDDSEKTVVVVVENNQVSKVTVDNVEVAVESAPGNAAVNTLGSGDVTAANNTVFALNASGYPDYGMGNPNEKKWFKQTIGNMMAFCIDDGAKTPNDVGDGGNAYTVFDPSEAPDLTDDTIKTIKKLLYYGAPYDSGTGALTQLIMDLGTSMGLTEYSNLSVAKSDLEYFTTQILKDITNEAQGLIDPQEDVGIAIPNSVETIERHVIGKFIDRQTGDILESDGKTYILDEIASRIWKNVIDPNTDYVADLVTLHYYTDKNNPNPVRQIEYGPYQRIIAAEFPALVSSVTLPAAFANSTVTTPTTGNLIIKKTFAGDLPTANQGALSFTVAGKNAGGEGVNTLTITYADFNNGQYKIENLPAGESYTVTETNAADLNKAYQLQAGSKSSASGTIAAGQDTTLTFTNTYAKKTVDVKVNKTWAGLEESDAPTVTVTLHANGTATDKTAALTKSNTTVSWTGLDAVDASGNAITYTVVEADLEGFTKAQNSSSKTEGALTTVTVNLTNTKDEQEENATVTVNVEKKWDGEKGKSVSVQLMKDDIPTGAPVTLSAANEWKHSWTGLEKGSEYTVIEDESDEYELVGMQSSIFNDTDENVTIHYSIVNRLIPEEPTQEPVTVTVIKTWVGEAPDFLRVQLKKDGVNEGPEVTLNETNHWKYKWTDLEAGCFYTVVEILPDGYTQTNTVTDVDKEGNVTVKIENTKDTEANTFILKINKTDMGGKEIDGAIIVVKDNNKKVMGEEWTSQKGKVLELELQPGKYTFEELNAPKGYICVTTEIEFTIDEDGILTVHTTNVEPNGAVVVEDGIIILKDELDKEPSSAADEEEEEGKDTDSESSRFTPPGGNEEEEEIENTEGDGSGQLPPGGASEEEGNVNAELESPESASATEPAATLPYAGDEEGNLVDADAENPVSTPDTGDHSHLGLYWGLMCLAAMGCFALLTGSRKKEAK